MKRSIVYKVAASLTLLLLGLPAHAQSITVQGKVTDSAGTPVAGSATQFRVQILSPDAQRCVLFDETHTVDLSTSSGLFTINLNSSGGTVNPPNTYSLEEALSNRANFSVNSTYCASGSGMLTYTPAATDNRKLVIQFMDPGTMTGWETIPEMDMNPAPFAVDARMVGGYAASSFLRVGTGTAPTISAAQATELQNLAAGTSSLYLGVDTTTGAKIPTVSGNPSTPAAGSMWFDTSGGGALKYYDGTTVQTVGGGGGVAKTGDTMTGALILPTNGLTVGTSQLVVASGNVGIGTTGTTANLNVTGQIRTTAYNAGASMAINWDNGNNQYTTPAGGVCAGITMTNVQDGGTYTLGVKGLTSGTCSFSSAGLTFVYSPANAPVFTDTVYTLVRLGSTVYVSWVTGFQ